MRPMSPTFLPAVRDTWFLLPLFPRLPPLCAAKDLGGESALVFVKGDANYRRLIGDRLWPTDTPFSDVAGYFPTRLCALRTLKAELG